MPDGQTAKGMGKDVLWIALGRQRVGKTTVLNAAVQYFRSQGCEFEVWNADQQNRSHSLSTFFQDALMPAPGGLIDGRLWIEERLQDQVRRRTNAVLDPGGGWTGFSSLVEDIPLVGALGAEGIQVTGIFCIGPERADLDLSRTLRRCRPLHAAGDNDRAERRTGLVRAICGRCVCRRPGTSGIPGGCRSGCTHRDDAGAWLHVEGDGPRPDF